AFPPGTSSPETSSPGAGLSGLTRGSEGGAVRSGPDPFEPGDGSGWGDLGVFASPTTAGSSSGVAGLTAAALGAAWSLFSPAPVASVPPGSSLVTGAGAGGSDFGAAPGDSSSSKGVVTGGRGDSDAGPDGGGFAGPPAGDEPGPGDELGAGD